MPQCAHLAFNSFEICAHLDVRESGGCAKTRTMALAPRSAAAHVTSHAQMSTWTSWDKGYNRIRAAAGGREISGSTGSA